MIRNEPQSNLTSFQEEEIEEQFTTWWRGPDDPDAVAYASRKGISFYEVDNSDGDNDTILELGGATPIDIGPLNSRQFSPDKFRAANLASDAEERARHGADHQLTTGQDIVQRRNWETAPPGEKLRTRRAWFKMYSDYLAAVKKQIGKLKARLTLNPG
ncbi:uncharacterized protein LY89DRAFT_751637 [Mollisia scopiformis]|uniref:Uncharacterized protein n=1 Tax=Mollisia scopiformis TaxID=149040 RepID=A0A194X5A1_MOLSC|nr:uncharacterized protein LY89DRAFT_751637 [Mollisia scopiformis]KUJ14987.1 hypothetical protein LY89DRAFT_751637 [Mollisia scopiformis]